MSDTPGVFIAVCPNCLISLRVHREYSGRMVRCRHCDQAFRPFTPDFGTATGSAEYAMGPISRPEGRPDLIVSCPSCATTLSVRARYAGRHVRCGGCGNKFQVNADEARPEPSSPSPLPPPASPSAGGDDARTPDPDVGPVEVARLVQEVASLRRRNDRLVGRLDEVKREVALMEARLERLEADQGEPVARDVRPEEQVVRNPHRLMLVDPSERRDAVEHDHDDRRSTISFHADRSAVSGG